MVVEPDGVSLTGLIDTGALCSAPARPTIEMWQNARHKKKRRRAFVSSMKSIRRLIPAPDFAGTGKTIPRPVNTGKGKSRFF